MNKLIKAYVERYHLIEMHPPQGILYEERMWKNPKNSLRCKMWYSESEIKSYIEDMDKYEIAELQRSIK